MGIFSRKKKDVPTPAVNFHISLEHKGRLVYDIYTDAYSREIVIGRAPECTWSLDGIDQSVSTKHALISKRKSNFYISDLGSRNGVFLQNKRITECKLAGDERFSLGESVIVVEKVEAKTGASSKFHRLSYTNEKGKQVIVSLDKPQMILGSDPSSDIVINEPTISNQHVELTLKSDGSCWIRDLGSRNGTTVNGVEVMPDTERMLKDNDVITIAYFDIKFWDAEGEHQESRLGSSMITIAVTIVVLLCGYMAYGILTPDAPQLIRMAEKAMALGDLNMAESILESMQDSKGYVDVKYQCVQLQNKINQWRNTQKTWRRVQKHLLNKDFSSAVQEVSTIIGTDDMSLWTWHIGTDRGEEEKKKAEVIKRLLDACYSSLAALNNSMSAIDELERCTSALKNAIKEAKDSGEDYVKAVVEYSEPCLSLMEKTLKDDHDLKETLQMLDVLEPDYAAIEKRLKAIRERSTGPVKARAERVMPAIVTMNREIMRTREMIAKVGEMDFKAVNDFQLDLPDTIDYSTEKNLGSLKNQLIAKVGQFKDTAVQLSMIYNSLVKHGIEVGKSMESLAVFEDEKVMKRVYDVDSLKMPLPKASRIGVHGMPMAAGDYDRLLGIEFFFDYVSNVPQSMSINVEELAIVPQIYKLKQAMVEVEKFVFFAGRDENQKWFSQGKIAEYLAFCRQLLKRRDEVIARQKSKRCEADSRQYVISRGIAAYLSSEGTDKGTLEAEVCSAFLNLKRKLVDMQRSYDRAMPEEKMRIRSEILRTGLPGGGMVKKMWGQIQKMGRND